MTLGIMTHDIECCYDECYDLLNIILNVVMLSFVLLNVVVPVVRVGLFFQSFTFCSGWGSNPVSVPAAPQLGTNIIKLFTSVIYEYLVRWCFIDATFIDSQFPQVCQLIVRSMVCQLIDMKLIDRPN
jgi:hypothetical protein